LKTVIVASSSQWSAKSNRDTLEVHTSHTVTFWYAYENKDNIFYHYQISLFFYIVLFFLLSRCPAVIDGTHTMSQFGETFLQPNTVIHVIITCPARVRVYTK